MNKKIIFIIAGITGLYFLAKRNLAKKVQFSLSNVSTSGTVLKPKIRISFLALNPSNQSATIKSIVGSLTVNNQFVGDVTSFIDQKILPNAQSIITVEITPSIISSLQTILHIIKNKSKNYNFSFKGNANVEGVVIPIENTISL
jgi:hypothetical protein